MKAGLATSLSIAGVLATGGAALVLNSSILDTASTTKGSPALATVVGVSDQAGITNLGDENASGSVTASGLADVVNGIEDPISVDAPTAALTPAVGASGTADASSSASPTATTEASKSIKQNNAAASVEEPTTTVDQPSPSSTSPTITVSPSTTTAAPVDKQFKIDGVATITLTASGGKLSVKSIDLVPGSGYKVGNQYSHDGDDVRITFTSAARTVEFSARLVKGQIVAAIGNPRNGNLMPPPPDGDDHDGDHDHHGDGDRDHHEEHEREDDDD